MKRRSRLGSSLLLLTALAWPAAARDRAPGFTRETLSLPGIPAALLPADLDGDGRPDLVVLVAYTGWTTRAEFEEAEFDDVEGLVEVMNVVDELVDRRELRVYRGGEGDDVLGELLAALDLDSTVHALATGHPAEPLIAATDSGAAAVRLVAEEGGARLVLTRLVDRETSFAGGGRFYPDLELLHDLNDDGLPELLLPTPDGWAVYRGLPGGFADRPTALVALPEAGPEERSAAQAGGGAGAGAGEGPGEDGVEDGETEADGDGDERPLHETRLEVEDCDGDGRRDLLLPGGVGDGPLIYRNLGRLGFAPAVEVRLGDGEEDGGEIVEVDDLDGDGRAEAVRRVELERYEDPGWREEVDEAKRPLFAYAAHDLGPGLEAAAEPAFEFRATGYTFSGSDADDEEAEIQLPGGFQDLDGDGRQDLVAITLDFSILPLAMRMLVVRRISLTMHFHVWCQDGDGRFRAVSGLDLSGRFKLDLDNLQVRHLSQFAGDFDGDGRADFVQLGRGRRVTIHRGRSGCRYPALPDHSIRLERKLRHLGLARILDLDGDGRSDLYVVHPLEREDRDSSVPVRVDLYLSRF